MILADELRHTTVVSLAQPIFWKLAPDTDSLRRNLRVAASSRSTLMSWATTARVLPSGEKASPDTSLLSLEARSLVVLRVRSVAISTRRTSDPASATASDLPSGEN